MPNLMPEVSNFVSKGIEAAKNVKSGNPFTNKIQKSTSSSAPNIFMLNSEILNRKP